MKFRSLKELETINIKKGDLWEWGLIFTAFGLGIGLNSFADIRLGVLAFIVFLLGILILTISAVISKNQAVE